MASECYWFLAMMVKLAQLGNDRKRWSRFGLDSDHIAEIILWLVIPFANRHGLAVAEELSDFLEDADLLLDMEEDDETVRRSAAVSTTPQCRRSASSFDGFRKFVIRVSMHELMDECELDWGHFNSFLRFLEKIRGKL